MVQSGGTSIVTGSIPDTAMAIVGDLNGGTNAGTYTLSSGAALIVNGALHVGGINITSQNTTANQALPAGVLTVNGGTLVVSELIKLWTGPGNAINFSAGSISTPELDGDVSEFNWTGGTLDFTAPAGIYRWHRWIFSEPESQYGNDAHRYFGEYREWWNIYDQWRHTQLRRGHYTQQRGFSQAAIQ